MKKFWHTFWAKQFRQPTGLLGRYVANKMQKRNAVTYEWMFSQMNFDKAKNVLEIGYGTGKLLNAVASQYPNLHLYGVDFSEVMYRKAKKYNDNFIKTKRMQLDYGDFLTYSPTVKFDVIYFTNVIYFWADIGDYFDKLNSLLNPDGQLYIYMADAECLNNLPMGRTEIFNKYSLDYVKKMLKDHQFNNINHQTKEINDRKTYCISALK